MYISFKNLLIDKSKETKENIELYYRIIDFINCIENGGGSKDLLQKTIEMQVNFVCSMNKDLKHMRTNDLKNRFNMMKSVLKQISFLSYNELFYIFPLPLYYEGEDNFMDFLYAKVCEAFDRCGIEFEGTDLNSKIGKNASECFFSIDNYAVKGFFIAFYDTIKLLMTRDKMLRRKESYINLFDNLEFFL